MAEKIVRLQKENRRSAIVTGARDALAAHIAALDERIGYKYMPAIAADFAAAVKGLSKVSAMESAVERELLRAKVLASSMADLICKNLRSLRELAGEHAFLFSDTASIVNKPNGDLVMLIKFRIGEHERAETLRLEVERARIRAEEEAKARQVAEAELAKIREEEWRVLEENSAVQRKKEADGEAAQYTIAEQERTKESQRLAAESLGNNMRETVATREAAIGNPMTSADIERPSIADIISMIAGAYGVDEAMATAWVMDIAEEMEVGRGHRN